MTTLLPASPSRRARIIPIERSLITDQQRRIAIVRRVLFLIDCWASAGELALHADRIEHLMRMANTVLTRTFAVLDASIFVADVDERSRGEVIIF